MNKKNIDNYKNSIWKFFFDEDSRLPLWILDDFVINYKDLKIEWFLIRDWFFNNSRIIKTSLINRRWESLFVSENSIKDLGFYKNIKNLLIEWNSIIWKKVVDETGENIWRVFNLVFSTSSFFWLSIIIRKSFFWLFFYWKERIISKKNILDINQKEIIIKNEILLKA